MLRFDRKQQNSVKQLSFNKKIKKLNVFFKVLFIDICLVSQALSKIQIFVGCPLQGQKFSSNFKNSVNNEHNMCSQ